MFRLALLTLGFTTAALAQFNRAGPPGGRVILFEKANFRGGAVVLFPGQGIENLAGVDFNNQVNANDRISSVRIEGNATVLLYEGARFRGNVLRLTESVANLADRPTADGRRAWNDAISSVMVEPARFGRGTDRSGADPDVIVKRAYQDLFGREPDEAGLSRYRSLIIDQGWTETMVRDALRNSAEFRTTAADKIIARAYQDLLGRDPDPEGQQLYRRLIIEKGYTEQQVRDAIRRGSEYKNRPK